MTIVGEECHIVAQAEGGARGKEAVPSGTLDGYANLLLLCRNCHRLIDDQPEVYDVSRLQGIKQDHEEWVAQATRADGQQIDRATVLDQLLRDSRARCIERWQALGVPYALAVEFADDADVGAFPTSGLASGPVTILIGGVGSGKSLAGERWHQAQLGLAMSDPHAARPVWARARELATNFDDALAQRLAPLGERSASSSPLALVVDGLDELGPNGAATLLNSLRRLANSRPGTHVLATTRVLEGIGNPDERLAIEPLGREAAEQLVARVSGAASTHLGMWPESIAEAAHRPLFAIALGRILTEDSSGPRTPAEVITRLVTQAIGEEWHELREPLSRLAIRSLLHDGGGVRAAEVLPAHALMPLLGTRMVVEDHGLIRFPLILFAQWFAAQALLDNTVDVGELVADPATLEVWRYPLSIAIAGASERRAVELLEPLTGLAPGFASLVLSETVRQYGSEGQSVARWQEAALSVRRAESAWVEALGPLGRYIAPVDLPSGELAALGARVDNGRLTTAWYRGEEARTATFELPADFFVLDAPGYGPGRSGRPSASPAWSWVWTRDELGRGLKSLVEKRRLPMAGSPLEAEAVWAVTLRALGQGAGESNPIDVSDLAAQVEGADELFAGGRFIPVSGLAECLARHVDNDGLLHPPWPGPDRDRAGSSWVWGPFGPERTRERAEAIFTAALNAYRYFAEGLFAKLAPRMRIASTIPAVARGSIWFDEDGFLPGSPGLSWWLEPTTNGTTGAVFDLRTWNELEDPFPEIGEILRARRPHAARWVHSVWHRGVLEIFGAAPAQQLVYEWLWDDLRDLGWFGQGTFGSWPYGAIPLLTTVAS